MMVRWSRVGPLILLLAVIGLVVLVGRAMLHTPSGPEEPPARAPRPRLAVLVVFDQLCADYLERWQELFDRDGFRRLQTGGTWFRNCHYPYAYTVTGAGHASVLTGCNPATHGIVGNEWLDRESGATAYCVSCVRSQRVPPLPHPGADVPGGGKGRGGVSPDRLLVPTLADALKEATAGRGRVVSLSLKDRSAILPVGRGGDACYWFDSGNCTFVTSTCYCDRLHDWVAAFNQQRRADRWRGQQWNRFRSDIDYESYSGPDDGPGESVGIQVKEGDRVVAQQGVRFPHPFPDGRYGEALYNSPQGNDILLELALLAIQEEQLGRDDDPDLLCISFSSNDPIGHAWGAESQEVLDVTLRSDQVVRELLRFLDREVGPENYVLVLTADHGVCPLPEARTRKGLDGKRIDSKALTASAEAFLDLTFGPGPGKWFEVVSYPWLYLNSDTLRQRQLTSAAVEGALAGWFREQPDIAAAFSKTDLLSSPRAEDDALAQAVRRSCHPERSGDVYVLQKPYCLFSSAFGRTGTTHGTPYPYDTHVPLLAYGRGFPAAVENEGMVPQQAAVLLAHGLGIAPPGRAEYTLPRRLKNQ